MQEGQHEDDDDGEEEEEEEDEDEDDDWDWMHFDMGLMVDLVRKDCESLVC